MCHVSFPNLVKIGRRKVYKIFSGITSKLEVHSAERIYLRQRCFGASKRRVAASTGPQYQYVHVIFGIFPT